MSARRKLGHSRLNQATLVYLAILIGAFLLGDYLFLGVLLGIFPFSGLTITSYTPMLSMTGLAVALFGFVLALISLLVIVMLLRRRH